MVDRFEGYEDEYDCWFETPAGRLVLEYEKELVSALFPVKPGDVILDAGCGTGIFTADILREGARVVGLDSAGSMLQQARRRLDGFSFSAVRGDMIRLPFADKTFDAAISITALEFIEDARRAIEEMFRVTRSGGTIVVATLNSLSSWAARRKARTGKHVLQGAFYRSPEDLLALGMVPGIVKTAIHFEKDDGPAVAGKKERAGRENDAETGAFVVAKWEKPEIPE